MNHYKMVIQYDGGRYRGWQRLGAGEQTIQAKIESVLSQFTGCNTEILGSSRTDAGVHALAQVAHFKTNQIAAEADIKQYLNEYLPQDICVIEVSAVSEQFHARYHAKSKTYFYQIWNREYQNPFVRKYSMHVKQKLDISSMKQAAADFLGKHDFTAFSNAKSNKKSMIRTIHAIGIEEQDGFVRIRVTGDGFLYNMVRKMVGVLIAVGLGQVDAESIPDIIASKERRQAGYLADACGLYLESVEYKSHP